MTARLEKREQADAIALLTAIGAAVYTLGTRRPRGRACPGCGAFVAESQGTCQTPGIPDLLAILPLRGDVRRVLFVELKRATGSRFSPAQRAFRTVCEASTAAYVAGTVDDLIAYLEGAGYLARRRGSLRDQVMDLFDAAHAETGESDAG